MNCSEVYNKIRKNALRPYLSRTGQTNFEFCVIDSFVNSEICSYFHFRLEKSSLVCSQIVPLNSIVESVTVWTGLPHRVINRFVLREERMADFKRGSWVTFKKGNEEMDARVLSYRPMTKEYNVSLTNGDTLLIKPSAITSVSFDPT